MVPRGGIEPSGFAGTSLHAASAFRIRAILELNGARGRDRTTDTAIFSRMLYQLSYPGTARGEGPGAPVYSQAGGPCPPGFAGREPASLLQPNCWEIRLTRLRGLAGFEDTPSL